MTTDASSIESAAFIDRSVRVGFALSLLAGGAPALLIVVLGWATVYGPRFWGVPAAEVLVLPAVLAFAALLFAGALLLPRRTREVAKGVVAFAVGTLALTFLGVGVASAVRARGFSELARQARPLVQAIKDYSEQHGNPPSSLQQLDGVIDMSTFPEFWYVTGRRSVDHFDGNPWALSLAVSIGLYNVDEFVYYPMQNYSGSVRGGVVRPVEDWAYVHRWIHPVR